MVPAGGIHATLGSCTSVSWICMIFSLNHIKLPNISPMDIVFTFGARPALLKKSVENGNFHAFSPMKFVTQTDQIEGHVQL